ncbi:CXXC-20-CXXC protein [Planomicrobium sp. HSC-17F08]|nr:CXXC-20-CXXC protein [Planomicrobium sp. HSC-17F08]
MPTCTHCQTKWTWKKTIKKTFKLTLSGKLICPVCGKGQYISLKSRKKIGFLNMLIVLPFLLNAIASVNPLIIIGFMVLLFCFCVAYMPFLTELSAEEEPLW